MLSEKQNVPKKKFKVPHTFVIIIGIVFIASILTWILPAGEFARVENAQGIKVVVPDQFSFIAKTPVNPLLIPNYYRRFFQQCQTDFYGHHVWWCF